MLAVRQTPESGKFEPMSRRFQFSLRSVFWAILLMAIGLLAIRTAVVAGPYWLARPHQRQVEKRYAEKAAEIERLREKQRALATPDPELNSKIESLSYELDFEELPDSLGGDLNRQ